MESRLTIADLGTGSGLYAVEVADEYPSCRVVGVDISPVQPTWVPSNCEFLVDGLPFDTGSVDMTHSRYKMFL